MGEKSKRDIQQRKKKKGREERYKIKNEEKKKEPSVILGQYVYHSHQPGRVCTTVCNWKKSRVENPSRKVQKEG
jgi:hypothetical protein